MKVTVEFLGPVRTLAETKEAEVDLNDEARIRDLLVAISEKFPQLLNRVIDAEAFKLKEPYGLSVEGRYAVKDVDAKIGKNNRILIFPIEAGG